MSSPDVGAYALILLLFPLGDTSCSSLRNGASLTDLEKNIGSINGRSHNCCPAGPGRSENHPAFGIRPGLRDFNRRTWLAASSLVLVHLAALHHEHHAAHGGDVLKRIAVQGDDVGLQAGSNQTDFILHIQ